MSVRYSECGDAFLASVAVRRWTLPVVARYALNVVSLLSVRVGFSRSRRLHAPYSRFLGLSVLGHDEDVVFESAVQVNGERARDFRKETPSFDVLYKRSIG